MEHLIESLKHLNWLAVLVAAFAGFSLGALWYSPLLFVKAWMKESKIDPNNKDKTHGTNMALTFGTAFFLQFVAAAFVALVCQGGDAAHGAMTATLIGVVWVSTSMGIHYLFESKSLKLFFINAGYSTLSFTVMGVILGAWH